MKQYLNFDQQKIQCYNYYKRVHKHNTCLQLCRNLLNAITKFAYIGASYDKFIEKENKNLITTGVGQKNFKKWKNYQQIHNYR